MKALVLEEYNRLVYKDVPDPDIKPDEVLVRVKACGICGSDVHGMDGSTGRRIPPLIMGHEASGVVEAVGSEVKNWKPGDRVTFDSTVYRLDDWYTLQGRYNISDGREVLGVSPGEYRRNGCFAELVAIPQHILYRIPEKVTFEQAAMVEAAAVALHAINMSGMKTGDNCVVTGAGMISIFVLKLLSIAGAGRLIAVDIDSGKLESALKCGAEYALNPDDKEIVNRITSLNGGRGADVSFEAVGQSTTLDLAIEITRKGGTVVLIGNTSRSVEFPLQKVVTRELRIQASCAIRGEYETILKFIETGKLNVDDQISAVAPLSEGAEWFSRLYNREKGLNKVILIP
ncbi:MAG: galactitol-1-phosphate 5-dehydrogenase [Bacteroidales bacterium]|nr:galactitol-1-phosphate 5-dehydrogenase [Bacteroidales bacterium]